MSAAKKSNSAKKASSSQKPSFVEKWPDVWSAVETVMRCAPGIVCVDLDGVLLYHESDWEACRLGPVLPNGRNLVNALRELKHRVIVLTSRREPTYEHIYDYLAYSGIHICQITNVKPAALAYFDDKAVHVPKNWGLKL